MMVCRKRARSVFEILARRTETFGVVAIDGNNKVVFFKFVVGALVNGVNCRKKLKSRRRIVLAIDVGAESELF